MNASRSESYRSWLIGELLLVSLLGSAAAFFASTQALGGYALPQARLALDTAVAVVATIVAILAAIRFLVEGRAMDLMLATGFFAVGLGNLAFGVAPLLRGDMLGPSEAWAGLVAELAAATLIAVSPFLHRRISVRRRPLLTSGGVVAILLAGGWIVAHSVVPDSPLVGPVADRTIPLTVSFALLAVLAVVALVGFGLRYRRHGRDLDSWLALAMTLFVFADLHYVLTPVLSSEYVLQGDFLRLLSYGILLVGVWRAISSAEFGRAVAEERARVAREIHDGLAQYLFAISTHVSMLESGASLDELLPRLKHASTAAQQEARFAVLALSSASGNAPFDAALRRYIDLLAADGELEIELDIDPGVALAPDEQIEIFRIVQEGLANARRHGGAKRVEVAISQRGGRRIVCVHDDGAGFESEGNGAGQGLKNMRLRAASIDGGFSLDSQPGAGTSIEVVLRPV